MSHDIHHRTTIHIILIIIIILFYPTLSMAQEATSEATLTPISSIQEVQPSESAPTQISTGNTKTTMNIDTNTNLNVVGDNQCQTFINQYQTSQKTLDLSNVDKDSCTPLPQDKDKESIQPVTDITNDSKIGQQVITASNTGLNTASSEAKVIINTGDAKVDTNISNITNTNLIGNNTYFAVINIFNPQQGDIILPYEKDFIKSSTDPDNKSFSGPISIINNSQLDNAIITEANTGMNNLTSPNTELVSGDTTVRIQSLDMVNMTNLDSNYIIVQIQKPENWQGKVVGWWGDVEDKDGSLWLSYHGNPSQYTVSPEITISNNAQIQNNLLLIAQTGSNSATSSDSATIHTGNATIKANLLNMTNTTLIGNNWYHVLINVFDTLKGDIVFPRPDLAVQIPQDSKNIDQGNTVNFAFDYQNHGQVWAKNSNIEIPLPQGADFIQASGNGILKDGKIVWQLGKIEKGVTNILSFSLKPLTGIQKLIGKIRITTSTDEPDTVNNETWFQILVNQIINNTEQNVASNEIPMNNGVQEANVEEETLITSALPATHIFSDVQDNFIPETASTIISQPQKREVLSTSSSRNISKVADINATPFSLLYISGVLAFFVKQLLDA